MLKFGFGVPRLGQKLPPITGGSCWRNNEGKYAELLQKTEISWRQETNSLLCGTGKEFPAGLLDVEVFSRALLPAAPARSCLSVSLLLPGAPQVLLPSVEMHPSDVRKKRQGREIPLYGSNQENGDLSWRLTVLLLSVCFSCHEIQPCELRGCSTDPQKVQ